MIEFMTILEHNHVYKYYFKSGPNNLNNISFYKRNMKQTARRYSANVLYNRSCGLQTLNYYTFNSNSFNFTRYEFSNFIANTFQKLRNL